MNILVFDTETTGLPKSTFSKVHNTREWPFIVQISYILFDNDSNEILVANDHIIKMKKNITISDESVNIHGISNERSQKEGIPIQEGLTLLMKCMESANIIVGHNVNFDKNMIMVELHRNSNQFPNKGSYKTISLGGSEDFDIEQLYIKDFICTMKMGLNICNIKVQNVFTGEITKKYPKLLELHKHLFSCEPKNLHNSFIDVIVCLRCYYYIENKKDLYKTQRTFKALYNNYCE